MTINEVIYSLQEYDFIFQRLASSCLIKDNSSIPTCGVSIDRDLKKIVIDINFNWFNSLDLKTQQFVLLHEICHIIFDYFGRVQNFSDKIKFNIAQDLVINHTIVDQLGFNREDLIDWNKYCWLDTVKFTSHAYPYESADAYYSIIDMQDGYNKSLLLDKNKPSSQEDKEITEEILSSIFLNMSNPTNSAMEFENKMCSSIGSYNDNHLSQIIELKIINEQWKKLPRLLNRDKDVEEDTWTKRNYRISANELILPTIKDNDEKKKSEIYLFLDCSGSCLRLKKKFVKALNSIPKHIYKIIPFSFTTFVKPVKDDKYIKTGGTSFKRIAEFIDSLKTYPDNIFIFTDGEGDCFNTKYPERWSWFIDFEAHNTIRYIPRQSKIYCLQTLKRKYKNRDKINKNKTN